MATSMTNLFNFGRPLPEPFEKLPNKKVKGTASKYGGLEATLCAPVIKGVNAFCACVNGTGQGAVGHIEGQRYVAEYKSSMGADTYHLVVYDASTGNFSPASTTATPSSWSSTQLIPAHGTERPCSSP